MTISKKATNRLWDVGDLALMVERRAAGPGPRGPYGKTR